MARRERAQRGAEAATGGGKKKKKSHSVFMLNGCPERAVDSLDNDMIGATCVWMTFLSKDSDSHVCHLSSVSPFPLVSASS